ncbi:MAG: tripartite tricarboxylate transporter TctB family protein [Syntrophobacteraceae bacterium]
MKTQRSADVVAGCFLAVLGILVIIAASQIRGGMEERLPPRTLPYTVGAMILAGGAFLALKSRRSGKETPITWPDRGAMIRIAVYFLVVGVYVLAITPIGFPLASGLYIAFATWYLKRTAIWTALISGVVTGIFCYYVFGELLGLSLPLGTLFFD